MYNRKILFEPFKDGYNVYTATPIEEYELLCFIEKETLIEDVAYYESLGAEVFFGKSSDFVVNLTI
tara:strand:- start:183 stop:380 length:198 start_codon:yes stop_codon:yes gene_type:complete